MVKQEVDDLCRHERLACARAYGIPLEDEEAVRADYYRPPEDSEEMQYLRERRGALGGFLPSRRRNCEPLEIPELEVYGPGWRMFPDVEERCQAEIDELESTIERQHAEEQPSGRCGCRETDAMFSSAPREFGILWASHSP